MPAVGTEGWLGGPMQAAGMGLSVLYTQTRHQLHPLGPEGESLQVTGSFLLWGSWSCRQRGQGTVSVDSLQILPVQGLGVQSPKHDCTGKGQNLGGRRPRF